MKQLSSITDQNGKFVAALMLGGLWKVYRRLVVGEVVSFTYQGADEVIEDNLIVYSHPDCVIAKGDGMMVYIAWMMDTGMETTLVMEKEIGQLWEGYISVIEEPESDEAMFALIRSKKIKLELGHGYLDVPGFSTGTYGQGPKTQPPKS